MTCEGEFQEILKGSGSIVRIKEGDSTQDWEDLEI